MDSVSIRWILSGRVQGVGFREHCWRAAEDHGIQGFVRNVPDGTLELEALGASADVESFLELVRGGPRGSRVDSVETGPAQYSERFVGFQIVY